MNEQPKKLCVKCGEEIDEQPKNPDLCAACYDFIQVFDEESLDKCIAYMKSTEENQTDTSGDFDDEIYEDYFGDYDVFLCDDDDWPDDDDWFDDDEDDELDDLISHKETSHEK